MMNPLQDMDSENWQLHYDDMRQIPFAFTGLALQRHEHPRQHKLLGQFKHRRDRLFLTGVSVRLLTCLCKSTISC